MSRDDWRSPRAYEDLRSLDAPGFAWEFLRRNADFKQDHEKLERAAREGTLDPAEVDAFTQRWGVRFREHQERAQPELNSLGGAGAPERDRTDEAAG